MSLLVDEKEDVEIQEGIFLRTIIRKDVHERLKEFAHRYATGRGNWDMGVAIQILLEHYEESKLAIINDKLDLLINGLSQPEKIVEKKYEEFLGGSREEIN